MISTLLQELLAQGREASLVAYLLVTLIIFGLAFYKEWIVLGKAYRRESDDCASKTKTLAEVNDKLVEQRILNERVTMALEDRKERIERLERDLARAEGRRWHKEGHTR
jgi:uncharacterized coiled-coil protein SlyX